MPRRIALILPLCLAALAAGCGSDEEETTTTTEAETEAETETEAEGTPVPDVELGVRVEDVEVLEGTGEVETGDQALRVAAVAAGSPAEEAGLEPSSLILEVDGEPVTTTADLFTALADNAPDDEVEVKIEGKQGAETLTITLAERSRAP
jgi:S1-C subfamily serine protease